MYYILFLNLIFGVLSGMKILSLENNVVGSHNSKGIFSNIDCGDSYEDLIRKITYRKNESTRLCINHNQYNIQKQTVEDVEKLKKILSRDADPILNLLQRYLVSDQVNRVYKRAWDNNEIDENEYKKYKTEYAKEYIKGHGIIMK
jgi:hypothetical protein